MTNTGTANLTNVTVSLTISPAIQHGLRAGDPGRDLRAWW